MSLGADNLGIRGRLEPLSVMFEEGQVTAICGPNGAGKSTLLAALAGLIETASGKAVLDGEDLKNRLPRERAQHIGYLPQDGETAWDVSVRNLVSLGRLPYGDEAPEMVDAALEALGLKAHANRPVSTLSGGEKARALLARVLAGQPRWVLADEPLAALDIGHQQALLSYLRQTAAAGTGVIMVLHDLSLAMNHADRVLVLDRGKLAADGAPENALATGVVERVWNVSANWAGSPGERALMVRPPGSA
ncbi:ATP-binding cassette domain-containing protein [Altererythrobacter luteolus]|uniref:ATP-binding cassette domain-containing protein n=1 Tax=Pontixanthobacter luteolus TaxID=295089 RepID=A0A6I4UXL3_9SPHN|nr:ATP-binding cassette domain-containing protein [Pontixanthobacter luteolus]